MTLIDWLSEFPGAITLCDATGIILYMNERSQEVFKQEGGIGLLGSNLLDCHPEPSKTHLKNIMETGIKNVYTIEKNGKKKLIYQSPWYKKGQFSGLVELALDIPDNLPHFKRD
jgi:transcriptional regulator with PAS, ATPase and Fis domain